MIVILLLVLGLVLGLAEELQANGKSLLGWAVVLIAAAGIIAQGGIYL